jgi:hypothetical protein
LEYEVGGWRKVCNEELCNLHSSPNIIRVMKSKRIRWVGHVARMGDIRNAYKILVGNLQKRDHLEDLVIGGMIILEQILKK